jgi:hypothetical protein
MRTKLVASFAAAMAGLCSFAGCTANVHDNVVNAQADLNFKANVDTDDIKPGDSVAVTMNATGVVLVDPNDTPAKGDEDKACFFKVFLDDEDSEPLVATAQTNVQVTIPQETPKGKHHLICRLFKHDDTPTETEQSIDINVSASATVMVNGGGAAGGGMAQP